MVNGLSKISLLVSIKSEMKLTVLYFFGIRNVGAPHWKRLTFFITLISSIQSGSFLNVSSCMRVTGKGFL